MILLRKVKIKSLDLEIFEAGVYKDNSKAIVIYEGGIPYIKLTVNFNLGPQKNGEYLIKTWGENASISSLLIEYGIFWDTGIRKNNGRVTASVWSIRNV